MAGSRPVLHLPITAAVCTGVYAVSLAAVTGLQAAEDAATTAARQPLVDAAARARVTRTMTLEAALRARDALDDASARYLDIVAASEGLDDSLSRLSEQVTQVSGAAAQLPATFGLPAAGGSVSMGAPSTQATTGASGQ